MKNVFFIYILTSLVILSNYVNAQMMINLNKYKEENSSLGLPKQGENRIVFMGNSITEDWKSLSPNFFLDNNYVNRGIGGETSTQMLLRFRSDVINLKPSAVVILAGINDIAENQGPISIPDIARNIFFMSQLASENNIKVILCSVLPAYDFPWRPGLNPKDKVISLNDLIQKHAQEKSFEYVDYFSSMVDERKGLIKEYGNDEVHPNLEGYRVMESIIQKSINKVLNK
jgi:lysophospholipase L1-like esterase